ncbi:MAG TPA: tungsten ABC transporter substrate-binding protein, partial [Dehalococcoidia bacterium]|nr:tungsten ABC transporter substrate-binding protein [Dehalococcoidia bacterium]
AYTLVDSSTFISVRDKVALEALLTDEDNPNVYTVMLVNPEKHDRVNIEAARAWADFVTSATGQAIIAVFGKGEYGEALFVPLANSVSGAPSR